MYLGHAHTYIHTYITEQNGTGKRDLPDDAKLVKVPSSSLSPKRLLEGNDNIGNVVPVPEGAEHHVAEPEQWDTRQLGLTAACRHTYVCT